MNGTLYLLIPLLLSYTAIAQPPGTFTATGSMVAPRADHTAKVLNNLDADALLTNLTDEIRSAPARQVFAIIP